MKQTGCHCKRYSLLLLGTFIAMAIFCDDHDIVFYMNGNVESMSVDSIDSITFPQRDSSMLVALCNRKPKLFDHVDSVKFVEDTGDTIQLLFQDDKIYVVNPKADIVDVNTRGTDVEIVSSISKPMVILAEGHCDDGRIIIDNNEDCTLILSDLQLSSKKGSAIYLKQKRKVSIELPTGTHSTLSDASIYSVDSTDTSNGCLYNKGSIAFKGEGTLTVTGNYRHGIASGKNVSVEGGNIIIDDVIKNAINCDKFTMKDGHVSFHLSQDASKGIKAKEWIDILGGYIKGDSMGNVTITDGDVSYCTLMKSDGSMYIAGGELELKNQGKGGRCISVDGNLIVTSGIMSLECNGDGDSYINEEGEVDYYTPKCITADDSVFINGGNLCCVSIGLGGKGIVSGKYLSIGELSDTEEPMINVKTKGTCIIDDVDEDQRFGCPKGIKADERLDIYGGNISVNTEGQGGEGVECNNEMYIYGGTLECNTYDDGINVGNRLDIEGGCVYCNSVNNDGIDSNGSITIFGGLVLSFNQKFPNESFDSDSGQLFLNGGSVLGVGSCPVKIAESSFPYYNTVNTNSEYGIYKSGITLLQEKYLYVIHGGELLLAVMIPETYENAFITTTMPFYREDEMCSFYMGDKPLHSRGFFFDNKILINGDPRNMIFITDFFPKNNQ